MTAKANRSHRRNKKRYTKKQMSGGGFLDKFKFSKKNSPNEIRRKKYAESWIGNEPPVPTKFEEFKNKVKSFKNTAQKFVRRVTGKQQTNNTW